MFDFRQTNFVDNHKILAKHHEIQFTTFNDYQQKTLVACMRLSEKRYANVKVIPVTVYQSKGTQILHKTCMRISQQKYVIVILDTFNQVKETYTLQTSYMCLS